MIAPWREAIELLLEYGKIVYEESEASRSQARRTLKAWIRRRQAWEVAWREHERAVSRERRLLEGLHEEGADVHPAIGPGKVQADGGTVEGM